MYRLLGRIIAASLAALLSAALCVAAQKIDSSGIDLFEAAQQAYSQGHLDETLKLCDRTLEVEPDNLNALYLRGIVLMQLGKPADAERSLRQAVEIEGEIAAPHAALAEALLALDRTKDAEAELLRALAIDPALAGARINYAVVLWRRDAFADADRELARVEAENHATADSLVLHGQVLERLDRTKDAIATYGKAVDLDAKHADARAFRGRLRAKAGDTAGAIDDLTAANAIRPDPEVDRELTALRATAGDSAGAIEALRARVTKDPKDAEARRALADALGRAGRIDEAKKEIELLAEAAPNDASVYDLAGDVMVETAPLDAARFYLKAAQLEPENVDYRLKLGSALVRAGKYPAALEHLRFATQRSPDRREAHAGLAAALYGADDFAGAAEEFGWLAKREPDSAFVQFFLGASLYRIGDCPGAKAALERFVAHADSRHDKARIDEANLVLMQLKGRIERGDCKTPEKAKRGG